MWLLFKVLLGLFFRELHSARTRIYHPRHLLVLCVGTHLLSNNLSYVVWMGDMMADASAMSIR